MESRRYEPTPIDTSGVILPEELAPLWEMLARNTHEVWARQRLGEGWTFGETLNAEKKTHPDLIPYEELSEGEKEYDRNTSSEAIRVILALGYRIVKEER